ncbi:MAG: glyoxalase superfamily protein [Gaiellaceae bacterium]
MDYLGFNLDWQEGEGDRPIYMCVSRGPAAIHLSSHSGDGTPGTAVVIQVDDVAALHRELHSKHYSYMNPGIEPRGGRERTDRARSCFESDSVLRGRQEQSPIRMSTARMREGSRMTLEPGRLESARA